MPRVHEAVAVARVAVAVEDAIVASDMARVLSERGLAMDAMPLEQAMARRDSGAQVLAYAPHEPPTPDLAARLAPLCRARAEAERPVIMLCAFARVTGKAALHRAASLAYLRSFGAIVCIDPDEWIESICLVAGHGLPPGPRVAIVAPEGSWIRAAATTLANEAEILGSRFPSTATSTNRIEPTDIALVDRAALSPSTPERVGQALVVPVVSRAELLGADQRVPLVGLRAALGATAVAGALARRLDVGLGPDQSARDSDELIAELEPDLDRFQRQVDKLDTRAGDHEAKVLLASWGITVTRQAVATTPSAATRVAKKAGYPVEIKPWGPDQLSERDGCPVQREVQNAADVRRAVVAVAKAAGLPSGAPVIVRETPPPGREVSAQCVRIGPLGWMVTVEVAGAPDPVAAPAPLRPVEAAALARAVAASRAGDPAPDRDALADILLRASHLVVYHQDVIEALYLHRIIVTPRGEPSMVADAQAVLLPHRANQAGLL